MPRLGSNQNIHEEEQFGKFVSPNLYPVKIGQRDSLSKLQANDYVAFDGR
jgi:hypothetical protein